MSMVHARASIGPIRYGKPFERPIEYSVQFRQKARRVIRSITCAGYAATCVESTGASTKGHKAKRSLAYECTRAPPHDQGLYLCVR